jgi:mannose-6-phosphate isomerase-like protein (cupin superfamily)
MKKEIKVVNFQDKLSSFTDYWSPRIIGEVNTTQIKIAKLKGDFVMHHHEDEDEAFIVLRGVLKMVMKDKTLEINPGEMVVIPRGTPHQPIAEEEVHIILIEPSTTLNTGNVRNELTKDELEQI